MDKSTINLTSFDINSLIQLFEQHQDSSLVINNNCKLVKINFLEILHHFDGNRKKLQLFFKFLFDTKIIYNIFKTDVIGLSTDYFTKNYNTIFIQQMLLISLSRSNPKNFKYNAKILGISKQNYAHIHYIYKNWQDLTNINLLKPNSQFKLLKFFIENEHFHVDQLFLDYSYEHYMFNSDFQLKWMNNKIKAINQNVLNQSKKNIIQFLKDQK